MSRKLCVPIFAVCACVAAAIAAFGQVERPQTWAQDIAYLQQLTPAQAAAQQSTILQIHSDVQLWIKIHPDSKLQLAAAPAPPLTADKAKAEIKELNRVITAIIAQDPTHPFPLGTVNVNVTAQENEISTLSDTITQTEFTKHNEFNAASAMEYLPGVSITHSYGGRNQEMVSVHGFGYLQVPMYIDGIPMNDPYDGTMDFRQFQTSDIAEIQISKGFSSALMGPNAVGGAINIVSKEPQKKYEGEMLTGGYSGDGFLSSLRLGTRWNHYFAEGSLDWLQDNYIPLSGDFATNTLQANDQMNLTYSHDAKYSGRIGWSPKGQDEYIFSYYNQKAKSGIPLSTGNDPLIGTGCGAGATAKSCYFSSAYRAWNFWDKTTYYFHSNTGLGEKSSIKLRVFYDQYPNRMDFFTTAPSVAPYSSATLNTSPGYVTTYQDHADGFSTEFNSNLVKKNSISASFYFKDDTHKVVPLYAYANKYPDAPAYGLDRQQTASIGLQDVITIAPNLIATVGMSLDHIDGLRANNDGISYYYNSSGAFVPDPSTKKYTPDSTYFAFVTPFCNTTNTNLLDFTACTPHEWAYNPQASFDYTFKDSSKLFFGYARKSRFAGMKERFSAKMGSSIANPDLNSEHSNNWEVGYSRSFAGHTSAQLMYFYSGLSNAIESIPVPASDLSSSLTSSYCTNTNGVIYCTVNENATHEAHQGAELTVHSTPIQRLTLDANYTYVNKKIDGYSFQGQALSGANYPCGGGYMLSGATVIDSTGDVDDTTYTPNNTCLTPTDLPKNKAVATATLRLPIKALLDSTLRYEGGTKAYDDYEPYYINGVSNSSTYYYALFRTSNFATWDLGGSVPLYKGAVIQAGVRNLLDRNYCYVLDYPEEGRNWFINMRYSF